MKVIEYYRVQNTGWSNQLSWFDVQASHYEALRFDDAEAAIAYIQRNKHHDDMKWRIVHVKIESVGNKKITTETYTEIE